MKCIRLFFVVALILLFVVPLSYSIDMIVIRPPKTINVIEGGSIQSAIDKAAEGDIISIAEGTYNENITLTKTGLTLQGAGRDTTIIESTSSSYVILVSTPIKCTIEDLTIKGGSKGGVACFYGVVSVKDCQIENAGARGGAFARYNGSMFVYRTILTENEVGAGGGHNAFVYIEDCQIYNNNQNGIGALRLAEIYIDGCNIYNNGTYGIYVQKQCHVVIDNTEVNGNTFSGVYVDESSSAAIDSSEIKNNTQWGIEAFDGSSVGCQNSTITGNTSGSINLGFGARSTLNGNTVTPTPISCDTTVLSRGDLVCP